jgi:hypothetical protein
VDQTGHIRHIVDMLERVLGHGYVKLTVRRELGEIYAAKLDAPSRVRVKPLAFGEFNALAIQINGQNRCSLIRRA